YCSDFGSSRLRVRDASVISAGATNDSVGPFLMNGRPPFDASTTAPAVRKPPTIPTRSPLRLFPSGGVGSPASGTAVLTCSDTAYPLSRIVGAKYIRWSRQLAGLSLTLLSKN